LKTRKLGAEAVLTERGGMATIHFPRLADSRALKHAVSTRVGGISRRPHGSLNVSFKVEDDPVRVAENRTLLSRALGMDLSRGVSLDQVHGDRVLKWDQAGPPPDGGPLGKGDGIITNLPGVPLMILVADCLPILIYDPVHKAAGLAHAGWRGTVGHTAVKTLFAMGEAYGTRPEEVRVALGPCIGPCCYEVGWDVKDEFSRSFPWASEILAPSALNRWKLDMPQAHARQLLEAGVREENLIRSGLCTVKHNDLFYSHRAEASSGKPTGRFGAFILLGG